MAEAALETVLRRDRIVVAAALAGLTALAWGYVLWLAADMDMGGMDMTGFRMIPAGIAIMAPANAPWGAIEFAFVFAMWAVMMVGMMAPSAAPMILMYARLGRQAAAGGTPFAATGWFAGGYFLTWIGFSLVATLAQWVLERAALLDVELASTSGVLGGAVLIAAGPPENLPQSQARARSTRLPATSLPSTKHCAITRSPFLGGDRPSQGVPAPTWMQRACLPSTRARNAARAAL
jgi:predicted metal-binding membrane protein